MLIELIRHGETALQAEKRYQGRTDGPLSDTGREKLQRADYCPEEVYVTPLLRCRQTAEILFPGCPQIVVPGLSEMNFGRFEGKNYIELEHDADYREWVDGMCTGTCPGGESKAEFTDRVCRAFLQLMKNAGGMQSDRLTIVAHGGTQMALLEQYGAERKDYWSWQLPCGCGYRLLAEDWGREKLLNVLEIVEYTI